MATKSIVRVDKKWHSGKWWEVVTCDKKDDEGTVVAKFLSEMNAERFANLLEQIEAGHILIVVR